MYITVDQSVVAFCDNFWNYVGLDEVCNTVEADEGWVKAGIIVSGQLIALLGLTYVLDSRTVPSDR